nr:hypothetical protein [Diaphorobacter sp. HDW4A]
MSAFEAKKPVISTAQLIRSATSISATSCLSSDGTVMRSSNSATASVFIIDTSPSDRPRRSPVRGFIS